MHKGKLNTHRKTCGTLSKMRPISLFKHISFAIIYIYNPTIMNKYFTNGSQLQTTTLEIMLPAFMSSDANIFRIFGQLI